jgi:hypothetical protein
VAAISPDVANLDPLFDAFITKLAAAAAADVALQGAVANVATLRTDALTKQQAARVAYNDFLRRIGAASMTAAQRQAFKRIFGDVDDLSPAQLGGAVRQAAEV